MKKTTLILLSVIFFGMGLGGLFFLYLSFGADNKSDVENSPFYKSSQTEQILEWRSDLVTYPEYVDATESALAEGQAIVDSREMTLHINTRIDMAAVQSGDFTSIAGTWQDSNGYTLIITPDGSVNNGKGQANFYSDNAISVYMTDTGTYFYLYVFPVNSRITNLHLTSEDPTDYGFDRLVAVIEPNMYFDYSGTQTLVNNQFLKKSDDYPTTTEEVTEEVTTEDNTEGYGD